MSEISVPTQFDRLEEKAVRYAIAVEARDALQNHLKYWTGVAAVIGAAAGWFGFSLNRQISTLHDSVTNQVQIVEQLQRKTDDLSKSLATREAELVRMTADLVAKQQTLETRTGQLDRSTQHITDMAVRFDSESRVTLKQLKDTAESSADRAKAIQADATAINVMKDDAAKAAEAATKSAKELEGVMTLANDFDRSIEGQRQVFRNALLDYVTLTRNARSPELILSTADPDVHYRVVFRTPSELRRNGFTLSYDVVTCRGARGGATDPCHEVVTQRQSDRVINFVRNERKWHTLEGTDGRYQFAVDYIFISKMARNYVTIRIGATDSLLPEMRRPPSALNVSK
jgi:hypothetical protein